MLQNFTYYAQFMLLMQSIMLYKFNSLFVLSYLNYKFMSISSPLSSLLASTQLTICLRMYMNTLNSFCCICIFIKYIFWQKKYHKFTQISQFCEKCVFYTNFVNCAGNVCLLCWHYAQCFCSPIMLKIMLT